MEGRNLGAADAEALEAQRFDELARFLGFWVAEDAATAGLLVGLAAGAAPQVGAGALAHRGRIQPGPEAEAGREHHQGLLLQPAVAVGKGQVAAGQHEGLAVAIGIKHGDLLEPLAGAAPLGAGIHHHGSPHRARDAHGPFQATQAGAGGPAGQGGDRFSGLGFDQAGGAIELAALEPPLAEGQAGQALVADQQVGTGANHLQGQALAPGPAGQGDHLVVGLGFPEPLGRSPHPPGGELGQGYPCQQPGWEPS